MSETTEPIKAKTRLIEVTMKFWKVFHVEVPEGVTKTEVLESELVENESGSFGDVELEHDETSTRDQGNKTLEEIERIKRHEKVFTWDEAQGN